MRSTRISLSAAIEKLGSAACDSSSLQREDVPKAISHAEHLRLIEADPFHPSYLLAKDLFEHAPPGITPGRILFRAPESPTIRGWMSQNLLPAQTVTYVHHPDLEFPAIAGEMNKRLDRNLPQKLATLDPKENPHLKYVCSANDLIRSANLFQGIASDYESRVPHHCPHNECPYHETNVCRKWLPTPGDWRRCLFPGYFVSRTNHLLDPTTMTARWFLWEDLVSRRRASDLPEWWEERWTPPTNWTMADWMTIGTGYERWQS